MTTNDGNIRRQKKAKTRRQTGEIAPLELKNKTRRKAIFVGNSKKRRQWNFDSIQQTSLWLNRVHNFPHLLRCFSLFLCHRFILQLLFTVLTSTFVIQSTVCFFVWLCLVIDALLCVYAVRDHNASN